MVLAVGARLSGQASLSTAASRCTAAAVASVELARPVIAMTGVPRRLSCGKIFSISSVSPELDIAITTSSLVIMPKSPWLASPGCIKKAGVPVDASVDAIFPPIWPLFPMPVTTTRPFFSEASNRSLCAAINASPSRNASARTASASISSVSRASLSVRSVSAIERGCNKLSMRLLYRYSFSSTLDEPSLPRSFLHEGRARK